MMSGNDLENSARKKSACTKLISLFSKHPQYFSSSKVNLHYIYHSFITIRAPAVDRQWRQFRKFRINVSKIEALANLLVTSDIYKLFLKKLIKLNKKNMSHVGWTHVPLFIDNRTCHQLKK